VPAQSTYAYKARNAAGEVTAGTVMASSADEVSARLRAEGQFVFEIDASPMRVLADLDEQQIRRNEAAKRVRREDVIAFCQQLSVMLETGVPLAEALDAFRRQTARPEFRQVLDVLADDIDSGEPLSAAMEKWPRVYPGMMISLMKASEASGTMATMLGRVGDYLAKDRRTVKQIKGALGYPLFMMASGVAITIFLMSFVLPRFARIYEQREASLPGPTKFLLAISEFITTQYHWYGPIAAVLLIALLIWVKRPLGRRMLDWIRLRIPGIRTMYTHLYVTRVTAVFKSSLVPPNVASMIAAGERSGQLPEVMEKISDFSQEELDGAVGQVTTYIEPIMIVFMGIVIGGVATALLLPIFNMGRVMSGG
jgi:type IV pilus assembly protein PilC